MLTYAPEKVIASFDDPWNPSRDEVVRWAYDVEALAPNQGFDLAVSWAPGLENTVLQLASDDACPKRRFFLSVIYLMVGDAVRAETIEHSRVEAFITSAGRFNHPDIRVWEDRARRLLKAPQEFDYHDWCDGGFAYGRR